MESMYNLVPHRIRVSFQSNGIYQFAAESATGKTYLYKQAYKQTNSSITSNRFERLSTYVNDYRKIS